MCVCVCVCGGGGGGGAGGCRALAPPPPRGQKLLVDIRRSHILCVRYVSGNKCDVTRIVCRLLLSVPALRLCGNFALFFICFLSFLSSPLHRHTVVLLDHLTIPSSGYLSPCFPPYWIFCALTLILSFEWRFRPLAP